MSMIQKLKSLLGIKTYPIHKVVELKGHDKWLALVKEGKYHNWYAIDANNPGKYKWYLTSPDHVQKYCLCDDELQACELITTNLKKPNGIQNLIKELNNANS